MQHYSSAKSFLLAKRQWVGVTKPVILDCGFFCCGFVVLIFFFFKLIHFFINEVLCDFGIRNLLTAFLLTMQVSNVPPVLFFFSLTKKASLRTERFLFSLRL